MNSRASVHLTDEQKGIVMKTDRQKKNWLIDATLFAGFLIAMLLDLTGLTAHQWLGVAVTALAGYHLLAHSNGSSR